MQTKTVDVHEAQIHLVELLSLVSAGTEIILTAGSTPWRASCPWRVPPRHALQGYILVPSGRVRILMHRCLKTSGQAHHESAAGHPCLHLVG